MYYIKESKKLRSNRSNLDLNKFIDLGSRKSSGNLFQIHAPIAKTFFAIMGVIIKEWYKKER